MNLKFSFKIGLIYFISIQANANLCLVQSPNQSSAPAGFDLTGIGDGCTLSGTFGGVHYDLSRLSSFERRQAERFKDTFHNSCVRHDKCLTEIGQSAQGCHDEFHGRMRQACDSAFKWYQYVDRELCRKTARGYYDAVMRFANESTAKYLQSATLVRARELAAKVDSDQCGSSVAHSGLFASDVERQIQSVFNRVVNRDATPYEQLKIATDRSLVDWREAWLTKLEEYAVSMRSAPVPPKIALVDRRSWGLNLNVQTDLPVNFIVANLNGKQTTDSSIYLFGQPAYDQRVNVRGTVRATGINGARNLLLVNQNHLLMGYCARNRRQMCF